MKNYTVQIEVKGKTKKKTILTFFYKGVEFGKRTSVKTPENFEAYTLIEKPNQEPSILSVGKLSTCEKSTKEMNNYYLREGLKDKAYTVLIKN
ncbi:hypothetical protein 7AX1_59 [uncultured Caudovirales phage]|uniref:Uncharacterized protein n=1 Tax=uncultured Caudovirales phage TaxID=2100421 RepID=A0A2H4IZ99_9CAUD|nr:hypothetical protein 7AX1_59 [uncultured Caudovirales phage]AXF38253.1 hypothetical protein Quidividi_020 [Staphylococcus phage Quidividi]AXF38455.1 hypothetical protein Twillingate_019 [Staphylococcus phage Twillingate]